MNPIPLIFKKRRREVLTMQKGCYDKMGEGLFLRPLLFRGSKGKVFKMLKFRSLIRYSPTSFRDVILLQFVK